MKRVPAALTLINADVGAGELAALRVSDGHLLEVAARAKRGDRVLDLRGDRLLPGFINAHDHLQLNSFPPLTYGMLYRNAGEWIRDFNLRQRTQATVQHAAAAPLPRRLLAGGLKNLLSGVTTVAHHDPFAPLLGRHDFPTQVPAGLGWSHSLEIDGDTAVQAACRECTAERPWIIHAAEGIDATAHAEFERLERLGCLRENTLLVHGVALDEPQRARLAAAGGGLIWCPSSNVRLFGRTAEVRGLIALRRVALGTDSRLTAAGDLLDELRTAAECEPWLSDQLEALVTRDAARLLRLPGRGVLEPGAAADLVVLPAGARLARLTRRALRLVIVRGEARYADGDYARALGGPWSPVTVDGQRKWLATPLTALLLQAGVELAGVQLTGSAGEAVCA